MANDAHPIIITDPSDGETSTFSIIKSSHPALYPGVVLGKPEYQSLQKFSDDSNKPQLGATESKDLSYAI